MVLNGYVSLLILYLTVYLIKEYKLCYTEYKTEQY